MNWKGRVRGVRRMVECGERYTQDADDFKRIGAKEEEGGGREHGGCMRS
jgi:hypothetical protein